MTIYTDDDFISIFKKIFEMDISKSDLLHCKQDLVRRVYTLFLKDFGLSVEKLSQIPFNAPEDMHQYPEMYRSTCFLFYLAKSMKGFLASISSNDEFTINDLLCPNWSRTRKFFSQLLDFYFHISEVLPLFEDVDEEVASKRDRMDQMHECIEGVKAQIRHREVENAEAQVSLEKDNKSLAGKKEEVEGVQEMKERLKGRLEGLKDEITQLGIKTKEKELLILESRERMATLQAQVIERREEDALRDQEARLVEQRATNDGIRDAIKELSRNSQMDQKAADTVKNVLIPSIEDYKAELKRKDELLLSKKEMEKELAHRVEQNEEEARRLQMLGERVARLQEERTQMQRSREVRMTGLEDDIKQMNLTLEELKRGNEEHEIVTKDLDAEYEKTVQDLKLTEDKLRDFFEVVKATILSNNEALEKFLEEDEQFLKHIRDSI